MWRITCYTTAISQASDSIASLAYLKEEQNNAIPAIIRKIPTKSNFFNVSHDKGSVFLCVFGTVTIATAKKPT